MGNDRELASSATLSRFENSMTKKDINNLFLGMIENFVGRIEEEADKIVLDFDPTDCAIYGKQEKGHIMDITKIIVFCHCMCLVETNLLRRY